MRLVSTDAGRVDDFCSTSPAPPNLLMLCSTASSISCGEAEVVSPPPYFRREENVNKDDEDEVIVAADKSLEL